MAVILGIVVLVSAMDMTASTKTVTIPLLLIGLDMGGLASQLGSVTVSAVPDELSPEVGDLQNMATHFGASLGMAVAGSILVTALTASFLTGLAYNPDVPVERMVAAPTAHAVQDRPRAIRWLVALLSRLQRDRHDNRALGVRLGG